MGGQMDRGKKALDAASNAGGAIVDALKDDKTREALGNAALDTVTEIAGDITDSVTNAGNNIAEKIKKEELTPDRLSQIFKETGADGVHGAIESAGFLSLFGGPVGAAARIGTLLSSDNGVTSVFNTLNGKSATTPEAKPEKFDLMNAIMTKDFGAIGGEITGWFSDITSMADTAKSLASTWGGSMGGQITGMIDNVMASITSFLPSISSMIGQFIPGFSFLSNDKTSTENQEQDTLAAEQEAALLAQQQKEELARQQAKAAPPKAEITPSPDEAKAEFDRVREEKPSPKDVEAQVIAQSPSLENLFKSNI